MPLEDEDPSPDSGVRGSDRPGPSSLLVALGYWPDRWRRATVLCALTVEGMMGALGAQDWTALLDRMEGAIEPDLFNRELF